MNFDDVRFSKRSFLTIALLLALSGCGGDAAKPQAGPSLQQLSSEFDQAEIAVTKTGCAFAVRDRFSGLVEKEVEVELKCEAEPEFEKASVRLDAVRRMREIGTSLLKLELSAENRAIVQGKVQVLEQAMPDFEQAVQVHVQAREKRRAAALQSLESARAARTRLEQMGCAFGSLYLSKCQAQNGLEAQVTMVSELQRYATGVADYERLWDESSGELRVVLPQVSSYDIEREERSIRQELLAIATRLTGYFGFECGGYYSDNCRVETQVGYFLKNRMYDAIVLERDALLRLDGALLLDPTLVSRLRPFLNETDIWKKKIYSIGISASLKVADQKPVDANSSWQRLPIDASMAELRERLLQIADAYEDAK